MGKTSVLGQPRFQRGAGRSGHYIGLIKMLSIQKAGSDRTTGPEIFAPSGI